MTIAAIVQTLRAGVIDITEAEVRVPTCVLRQSCAIAARS
jgi:hypothetical protein